MQRLLLLSFCDLPCTSQAVSSYFQSLPGLPPAILSVHSLDVASTTNAFCSSLAIVLVSLFEPFLSCPEFGNLSSVSGGDMMNLTPSIYPSLAASGSGSSDSGHSESSIRNPVFPSPRAYVVYSIDPLASLMANGAGNIEIEMSEELERIRNRKYVGFVSMVSTHTPRNAGS